MKKNFSFSIRSIYFIHIFPIFMKILHSSRRTLAIQINKDGEIIIRAPMRMKENTIREFVQAKQDWIEKHQQIIQESKQKTEQFPWTYLLFWERISWEIEQKELLKIYRKELDIYIHSRVPELLHGKSLPKITWIKITSAKTRWGSCSGKNSLNFSLFLGSYPKKVIDSVIIHEIAHLREKNHGPQFWKLVYDWMPEYAKYHAALRGKDIKDYE